MARIRLSCLWLMMRRRRGAPAVGDSTAGARFYPDFAAGQQSILRLGTLCARHVPPHHAERTHPLFAHLDMDAFYASVELLRYPELKGRPVVIGGGRRHQPTMVVRSRHRAAHAYVRNLRNYAGTRRGHDRDLRGARIRSPFGDGAHESRAARAATPCCCRSISMPTGNIRACSRTRCARSRHGSRITASTRSTSTSRTCIRTRQEPPSGSPTLDPWERVHIVARSIKEAVRAATGLSCSIGIAPNKLLAKIASELDKPDGLTLLRPGDMERRIWPLPARKINGIGPKSSAKLEALGVRHDRRPGGRRPGVARRAFRARRTARSCTTPRTAATSGTSSPRWSPNRSAAKRRSSAICRRGAIARSCRRSSPRFARA